MEMFDGLFNKKNNKDQASIDTKKAELATKYTTKKTGGEVEKTQKELNYKKLLLEAELSRSKRISAKKKKSLLTLRQIDKTDPKDN